MKLPKLDSPTRRLSLTYLGIIMVLVVGFSVVFYHTSTENLGGLSVQVEGGGRQASVTTKAAPTLPAVAGGVHLSGNPGPTLISGSTVADINRQLTEQVTSIRTSLWEHLLLLNIAALLVGTAFSYYLARRSLWPMEQAIDAQTRFTSDASHEFRTPLTALIARNEVALRKPKLTLAEARQAMQSSVDQAVKLQRLSEGLLRLSNGGGKPLKLTAVSLAEVATEAMNRVIAPAQAKRITLDDSVDDIQVIGDMDSLVQIVTILLDNAIKYSSRASTIYVDGTSEGKYGILRVRDEGSGIRATDLPHIFERFYRADYARTKQGEHGYGLGLSIAKRLTEQNNGKLTAESVLDEGSTFTLRVPR